MKKKRMGRPPVPKAKQRSHRITLGLTAAELAEATRLARSEGMEPAAWARKVVLRALQGGKR